MSACPEFVGSIEPGVGQVRFLTAMKYGSRSTVLRWASVPSKTIEDEEDQ
jgi:hypothetical protein